MSTIIEDALETYRANIKLIFLFSIMFVISFAIVLFAPLPTYNSAGAIFLRSASIFVNLNAFTAAVIVISVVFSLLFTSFAYVAISLIVKSKRTHVKTPAKVMRGIEGYTAKVFVVLLAYMIILALVNVLGYYIGASAVLTELFGFVIGLAVIFYAPSAIVVDDKSIWKAVRDSARLMVSAPQYFVIWLVLISAVITVLDFIFIHLLGTLLAPYALLVINLLFVVPYFVIFQAEAYMKRFPLLRH